MGESVLPSWRGEVGIWKIVWPSWGTKAGAEEPSQRSEVVLGGYSLAFLEGQGRGASWRIEVVLGNVVWPSWRVKAGAEQPSRRSEVVLGEIV